MVRSSSSVPFLLIDPHVVVVVVVVVVADDDVPKGQEEESLIQGDAFSSSSFTLGGSLRGIFSFVPSASYAVLIVLPLLLFSLFFFAFVEASLTSCMHSKQQAARDETVVVVLVVIVKSSRKSERKGHRTTHSLHVTSSRQSLPFFLRCSTHTL